MGSFPVEEPRRWCTFGGQVQPLPLQHSPFDNEKEMFLLHSCVAAGSVVPSISEPTFAAKPPVGVRDVRVFNRGFLREGRRPNQERVGR